MLLRPDVEIGISTAFGCTLAGTVSEDWVIGMAGLLAKAGADSIGLSDATGYANPAQIKRMFHRLRSEIGWLRVRCCCEGCQVRFFMATCRRLVCLRGLHTLVQKANFRFFRSLAYIFSLTFFP